MQVEIRYIVIKTQTNTSNFNIGKAKCNDYYWHLINNISHLSKAISDWENIYINFNKFVLIVVSRPIYIYIF